MKTTNMKDAEVMVTEAETGIPQELEEKPAKQFDIQGTTNKCLINCKGMKKPGRTRNRKQDTVSN